MTYGKDGLGSVRIDRKQTKMIAHRGLSGVETENTLPSFKRAARGSYYGIETDIHVTSDGRFAVFHDDTTKRMTDGKTEYTLENTDYATLRSLSLPDKWGHNGEGETFIPLLEEYIDACRAGDKYCVLELKNRFEEKDLISAVEVIRGTGYLDRLIFISFSDFNCITMRRLLPEAKVQFLTTGEINGELIGFLKKEKLDLDIEYKRLTKENIALLHSENIEVNCWTVDDKKAAEDLAKWGVDYITSNILE